MLKATFASRRQRMCNRASESKAVITRVRIGLIAVLIAVTSLLMAPLGVSAAGAEGLTLGPGEYQDPGGQSKFVEQPQYWRTVTLRVDPGGKFAFAGRKNVSDASAHGLFKRTKVTTYDLKISGVYDPVQGTFSGNFTIDREWVQDDKRGGEVPTSVHTDGSGAFSGGTISGQLKPGDKSVTLTFVGSDEYSFHEERSNGSKYDGQNSSKWAEIVVFPVDGEMSAAGSSEEESEAPRDGAPGEEAAEKGSAPSLPSAGVLAAIVAALLVIAGLIYAGFSKMAGGGAGGGETPTEEASAEETPAEDEEPEETGEDDDEEEREKILLTLTYPAGVSPKVFTTGWLFGARAIASLGTPDEQDLSDSVEWSGSADFDPPSGALSRPAFRSEGANTIILKVDLDGEVAVRNFSVTAISPAGYARVGSIAICPSDSHGCPACPHVVAGRVEQGSPHVFVGGMPAARQGDGGTHLPPDDVDTTDALYNSTGTVKVGPCCGENTFVISSGDSEVLIDGRPAALINSETRHCGGTGSLQS